MSATTGRSGRASLAAMAAGSPKPIDDHPLVIRNVRGAGAVHCEAIWWVWAPTSKARMPSSGSVSRTTSIAWWGAKAGNWGRSARWNRSRCRAAVSAGHAGESGGSAASHSSDASRSPTTSWATVTLASASTGSTSIDSSGTLPIHASYSTSTTS